MSTRAFSAKPIERQLPCGCLRYRRLGSGPDVVMLHGLLGSGRQWQECAERLARQFSCWVLELPGISRSEAVPDCSLPGLSGWLEQAVTELGIERFSLVAASWGGAIAMQYAWGEGSAPAAANRPANRSANRSANRPDGSELGGRAAAVQPPRLHRLALAAPVNPYWEPSWCQRGLLTAPWTQLAAGCGALLPLGVLRKFLAGSYGDAARIPPGSAEAYRTLLRRPGEGQAVADYARTWRADQRRLRAALKEVKRTAALHLPTLLIWGERDRVVPAASGLELRQDLPGCGWVLLAGLGHLPYEEAPAAFVGALEPFLMS